MTKTAPITLALIANDGAHFGAGAPVPAATASLVD
ncbi:hypothetical protein SAMN05216274_10792 [Cryobacterium levicorallinum]|uniref:Uncharacterized protein n=1 Tax=Cryobacterium levicorallinum TaxID=995038 RepID=A0ABY1EDT1_9MICO|nr:hypothetical protein SAMN05216274_10792 [Cryobacterium levicorallinum]